MVCIPVLFLHRDVRHPRHFFYKKLHFDTATFQTWSAFRCYFYIETYVTRGIFFIRSSTLTLPRFRRGLYIRCYFYVSDVTSYIRGYFYQIQPSDMTLNALRRLGSNIERSYLNRCFPASTRASVFRCSHPPRLFHPGAFL